MYKGLTVFGKAYRPYVSREPKEYVDNEACFVFVNKGEIGFRGPREQVQANMQNGVLAKCLNYLYEPATGSKSAQNEIEVVAVLLHKTLLEELFEYDFSKSDHTVNFNFKNVAIDALFHAFRSSIDVLIENPDLADEAMIRNKLKEFVLLLIKSNNSPSELDFLSAMFKPTHADFRAVVQANIYSSVTVDQLAHLCHMSKSSFKRKFKDVYNESPKKYIARKKIEKASGLLRIEGSRISDVAYDVGFETVSTFNRSFRAVIGKSPSEYRLTQSA